MQLQCSIKKDHRFIRRHRRFDCIALLPPIATPISALANYRRIVDAIADKASLPCSLSPAAAALRPFHLIRREKQLHVEPHPIQERTATPSLHLMAVTAQHNTFLNTAAFKGNKPKLPTDFLDFIINNNIALLNMCRQRRYARLFPMHHVLRVIPVCLHRLVIPPPAAQLLISDYMNPFPATSSYRLQSFHVDRLCICLADGKVQSD